MISYIKFNLSQPPFNHTKPSYGVTEKMLMVYFGFGLPYHMPPHS